MLDYTTSAKQFRERVGANVAAYRAAVNSARTFQDTDFSEEGLAHERQQRVAAARAQYGTDLDRIANDLATTAKLAANDAKRARPQFSRDDLEQAWSKVKMRLDAGMPLRQILANADPAEATAIAEYGPAHLDAEHFKNAGGHGLAEGPYTPPPTEQLTGAVDARLASVLGDAGAPLTATREFAAVVAELTPTIDHMRDTAAGVNTAGDLNAAVTSQMAGASARATSLPDAS